MSRPNSTRRSMSYQDTSQRRGAAEPVASTSRACPTDGLSLTIIVQPEKFIRFRYKHEQTPTAALRGATTYPTFPTIMIKNVQDYDEACITISVVTAEKPYRVHPNGLKGADCQSGVYLKVVRVRPGNNTFVFKDLRIYRVTATDFIDALGGKQALNIDPFRQGFNHKLSDVKLTKVRLCFQVTLLSCNRVLEPVVSTPICNRRICSEPKICHFLPSAGSARGGAKLIILSSALSPEKGDTDVVFFTEPSKNELPWECSAMSVKVHGTQSLFCFVPPYRDVDIKESVTVSFQLRRKSDGARSKPLSFKYLLDDTDEEVLNRKSLKQIDPNLSYYHQENSSAPSSKEYQQILDRYLPYNNPAEDDDDDDDDDDAEENIQPSLLDEDIPEIPSNSTTQGWSGLTHVSNTGNPFIEYVPEPQPSHSNREFYRQSSINLPVLHNQQINPAIMARNLYTPSNMQPMTQTSQNMLQSTQPNFHQISQNMLQSTQPNVHQISQNMLQSAQPNFQEISQNMLQSTQPNFHQISQNTLQSTQPNFHQISQNTLQSTQPNFHQISQNTHWTPTNTDQMTYSLEAQSNMSQGDMQTTQVRQSAQYNGYQVSENMQWMLPNEQFFSNNAQSSEYSQRHDQFASKSSISEADVQHNVENTDVDLLLLL